MIHFEKLGIYLSKPVAFILLLIYLVQSSLALYLVKNKFDLEKQVSFQQKKITELEEKLQLYKAIEDFQIGFTPDEVGNLTNVIYSESKKYSYDPLFIVSIIIAESSFKKHQVSEKGASGLMQLKPSTGADAATRAGVPWVGAPTLFESEANIKLGTYYLFEQILKHRDLKKALIAYNIGETKLRGIMRQNLPLPRQYVEKVMQTYKMLKETYRA
ncbi:MAG: lytic transglycosylase domain-containing protein [Candidatus Zixiibacteriota bacterium]